MWLRKWALAPAENHKIPCPISNAGCRCRYNPVCKHGVLFDVGNGKNKSTPPLQAGLYAKAGCRCRYSPVCKHGVPFDVGNGKNKSTPPLQAGLYAKAGCRCRYSPVCKHGVSFDLGNGKSKSTPPLQAGLYAKAGCRCRYSPVCKHGVPFDVGNGKNKSTPRLLEGCRPCMNFRLFQSTPSAPMQLILAAPIGVDRGALHHAFSHNRVARGPAAGDEDRGRVFGRR